MAVELFNFNCIKISTEFGSFKSASLYFTNTRNCLFQAKNLCHSSNAILREQKCHLLLILIILNISSWQKHNPITQINNMLFLLLYLSDYATVTATWHSSFHIKKNYQKVFWKLVLKLIDLCLIESFHVSFHSWSEGVWSIPKTPKGVMILEI